MYLLDTNTCIFIINQNPISARGKFNSIPISEIAISSITYFELDAGARKGTRAKDSLSKIQAFIRLVQVMPFDENAAQAAGELKQFLREQGTPIGDMDLLIAAHGLSLQAVIVTNNTKEFSRVPNLKLEDWLNP